MVGSAAGGQPLRLAIVTNIPAPYRVPVYNRIAADPGFQLLALYAARSEPDRAWNLPAFEHEAVYLQPRMRERNGRYIHNNPDVAMRLAAFKPDVVLTTGFNPTHLRGWAYTLARRCRHVGMTDGTDVSEAGLSAIHRAVRQVVYRTSGAFVAASEGGRRLFHRYGVDDRRIHFSPLCANEDVDWARDAGRSRDIDLLFSARLVRGKNPDFALRVAAGAARRLGRRLHMAVLGSGPEESAVRQQAADLAADGGLRVEFAGHVAQEDLPGWYHRGRVFLFPSSGDTWGVVANEAAKAGMPVIVTPAAGVAGELVRDGETGRVLPLDEAAWTSTVVELLQDEALRRQMGDAACARERRYSFQHAAWGIMDAARQAHDPQHFAGARCPFDGPISTSRRA